MADWQQSITLRLSLAFAVLATVVFAALGLYFSRAADAHMAELDAHGLFGKLALIGHVGKREGSAAAFVSRLGDALVGENGLLVTVDGDQAGHFRWPAGDPAEALSATGVALGSAPVRLSIGGAEYRVLAAEMETGWGGTARVVVARNIRHHTAFLDQLQHDFWLAVLGAALLTAIVGTLIVRRGLRPVRDIARTAGRISAGQLAERIPKQGLPPELAELGDAFNAMLGRLEASFARLSDFSADLAHELRTPIHSLRMQTEVSLSKARDVEAYRELLASNLEEYERLSRIIADMLFLAKAEHGLVVPQKEAVSLLDLCRRLIDYYGLLADDIAIAVRGEDRVVQGDRLMLERAIGNLLGNAIRHTPAGGRVELLLDETSGGVIRLAVRNTGSPIPPDALHGIFERFVRLDSGGEGSGLGLAIVKSIVLAHGGRVTAISDETLTEFTIEFPGAENPRDR